MLTVIRKRLKAKHMLLLFHNEKFIYIKNFFAINFDRREAYEDQIYTYDIEVRHNENEDPKQLLNNAYEQLIK